MADGASRTASAVMRVKAKAVWNVGSAGLRIDPPADVLPQSGVEFLGGRPPARFEVLDAADAGAGFVPAGVDGVASPAEGGLGEAGGPVAVWVRNLGLGPPPPVPGE